MNSTVLIFIAMTAFTLNSVCTRAFQTLLPDSKKHISSYQSLFCLFAAVCFFATSFPLEAPRLDTVLYGVVFGTLFFLVVIFMSKCFECGSMALTSVVVNMSLVIPVLYSYFSAGESVKALHIVGIVLFAVSFSLSAFDRSKPIKAGAIWMLFLIVAFLANGFCGVVQKHYAGHSPKPQMQLLMTIAYFTSFLLYAALDLYNLSKGRLKYSRRQNLKTVLIALASGFGSFGGNALVAYLCDKVEGAVLYPMVNGGFALLCMLSSFLIFKEKPDGKKLAAAGTGLVALVILSI